MTASGAAPGTIMPLTRRLVAAPDPLALYAALADRGETAHTFLLESADRASQDGERSLIGVRMALHVEAGLDRVRVRALSANGHAALPWLAGATGGRLEQDEVTLALDRNPVGCADEGRRFRQPSPLDLLRVLQQGPRLLARPAEWCHVLCGTLGYDLVDFFEALPPGRPDPLEQPVVECWVPDQLLVIDHRRRQTTVVTTAWGGEGYTARYHDAARALERLVGVVALAPDPAPTGSADPAPEPIEPPDDESDLDDEDFVRLVAGLQAHLHAGEAYQIVPSRTFRLPCSDPFGAYRELRRRSPSPYLFYLRGERRTLLGASPETCLRVDGASRQVAVLPIAGTAPRGRDAAGRPDADADSRLEVALRLDHKEAAEHLMLVDLARNDVARVSTPGSRRVGRLLAVERYAHVMHLVSEVVGTLRPGIDALEAYAATLNMGTLVGAPKVRAAALLREVEPSRRGCYGGAVGYLRDDDTLETAIVIRAALVQDGVAHVRAGAGVVLDSDPAREAEETRRKARAVLEAVTAAGALAHV